MRLKTMTEVKYDLDLNSKPCRGVLRYKDGAVYALEDGKEVFSLSLKNIGELVQYTDVGCGSLEISPFAEKSGSDYDDAENITVCRFSMSAAEDIGGCESQDKNRRGARADSGQRRQMPRLRQALSQGHGRLYVLCR